MRGLSIPASTAPLGQFVGITFRRVGQDGGHAGFAWREGKTISVLNHRDHMGLTLDAAPHERDAVVQLPLARARLEPTIRYAKRVHRIVGTNLPYNFRFPNDVFDKETGELLLKRGEGLTCSTFVLALLEATGTSLVRREEWPQRPDDKARHETLVEGRRQSFLAGNDNKLSDDALEHLAFMNLQVNSVRIRPEETAASASVRPLPASFKSAVDAATELLEEYDKAFAPPRPPSPPHTPAVEPSAGIQEPSQAVNPPARKGSTG